MKVNKQELWTNLLQETINQEEYELCAIIHDGITKLNPDETYEIDNNYNYQFNITKEGLSIAKSNTFEGC